MLEKISPSNFTWNRWRQGSIADFNIPCRELTIINEPAKTILRKYAIGYCYGENLPCRAKPNEVAVMFNYNDNNFWFHLRKKEFEVLFGNKLQDIGFYTLEDKRALGLGPKSPMWRCELILGGRCNFHCPYCRGPSKYFRDDITLENIYKTLDIWTDDNLKNLRLSGGEPTLYPDLVNIVKYANDRNVNRIAISTNGSANLDLYKKLIDNGVNDFSISLDACCSEDIDKMTGVKGYSNKIINNIKELSKLTYVTIGMVINENNRKDILNKIKYCESLGVSDIRIIPSAQYNELLIELQDIDLNMITLPILKYRIGNIKNNKNVRGINISNCNKCYLPIDDSVVAGKYHFPCVIYMREGGKPIGEIGPNMRVERIKWSKNHNSYNDPICRKNCLDVCLDHNTKCENFGIKI